MTTGKTILIFLLIVYAIIGFFIIIGNYVAEPERHRFSYFIDRLIYWLFPGALQWIIFLAWPILLLGDWLLDRRAARQARDAASKVKWGM
jgi:hypothetical protein